MKFGRVLKLNKIEKRSNITFIINKFKVPKWLLVSLVLYFKKTKNISIVLIPISGEAENWDWNHDTVIKDLANEEHWPTD